MSKSPQIVFWNPLNPVQEPYTTSDVIAEAAAVKRHSVTRLIQQHEADFQEFGSLRFQIEVRKRDVGASTVKNYLLNEQQATLLMTYLKKYGTGQSVQAGTGAPIL